MDKGRERKRSRKEGESRSQRLSVVVGVRSCSRSLLHTDIQVHTDRMLNTHTDSKHSFLNFSDRIYQADETDRSVCVCV